MAKHVPGKPQAGIPSSAELDSASGGAVGSTVAVKGAIEAGKWLAKKLVKDKAKEYVKDQISPAPSREEA